MINLDNRLRTAFELCRSGVISADVGTDHAKLAAALAEEKGCGVIAADIKDGPLAAARRTLCERGATRVSVVKSDGLDAIDFADDVIICGMGGELIADIVSRCRFTNENTRFILQPMTKAELLRKRLYKSGFELVEEKAADDGGKLYAVMLWRYSGISRDISEAEALCGKMTDARYLKGLAEKLLKNARGMERSEGRAEDAKRLRETAAAVLRRAEESAPSLFGHTLKGQK